MYAFQNLFVAFLKFAVIFSLNFLQAFSFIKSARTKRMLGGRVYVTGSFMSKIIQQFCSLENMVKVAGQILFCFAWSRWS
jgi:hypothetical protein